MLSQCLQELANELCDQHNLVHIPVIEDHTLLQHDDCNSEYDPHNGQWRIIIDERIDDKKKVIAVYHEWRHYWQHIMYPDIFRWWIDHKHAAIYRKYYYTKFNSIEADALEFGESLGQQNQEELLNEFDLNTLDWMIDHPDAIESWLDRLF